jgi:hypothetical protein
MRKLLKAAQLILWIAGLALVIRFGWWAYQHHRAAGEVSHAQEIPDIDKECRVVPDTGQCVCRNRWTDERLQVPHRECVALARRR